MKTARGLSCHWRLWADGERKESLWGALAQIPPRKNSLPNGTPDCSGEGWRRKGALCKGRDDGTRVLGVIKTAFVRKDRGGFGGRGEGKFGGGKYLGNESEREKGLFPQRK